MMKKYNTLLTIGFISYALFTPLETQASDAAYEVTPNSAIEWGALNPARGDKSPRAGTLWGDRTSEGASGFLVKFADGFSSPPHIHNVTYRGVVISGLVHNDDPKAQNMWLPAGSFWTQPAGEAHITAAQGDNNIAYIEIEEGPYLVKPESEAFDNGERPVNVDKTNLVWLDASNIKWIDDQSSGVQTAFLWGNPQGDNLNGRFIKLPKNFNGHIETEGNDFRAIVIQGSLQYTAGVQDEKTNLISGSYFGSEGDAVHKLYPEDETIIYVRTDQPFTIHSNKKE